MSPPKKGSGLPLILLTLLLFIALAGMGYFYLQTNALKYQLAAATGSKSVVAGNPGITPIITKKITLAPTSPATDPTANWQTYTNTKYGFSLKHPTDWKTVASEYEGQFFLAIDRKSNTSEAGYVPIQLMIDTAKDDEGKPLKLKTIAQAEERFRVSQDQKRATIMLDGQPAVVVSGIVDGEGPGTGAFLQYTFVKAGEKVLVIQLGQESYRPTYEKIISTLRFSQ